MSPLYYNTNQIFIQNLVSIIVESRYIGTLQQVSTPNITNTKFVYKIFNKILYVK